MAPAANTQPSTTPPGDDNARERLLQAGRYLFLRQEYHRVSIRRLAQRAGVNSAMIAYYFGDKRGLFQAVLASHIDPMRAAMLDRLVQTPNITYTELFRYFFRYAPRDLMRLIIRNALFEPDEQWTWILDHLLRPLLSEVEQRFGRVLPEGPLHRPEQARLALQSMLVFPILGQTLLESVRGAPMDEAFFDDLAEYFGLLLDRAFAEDAKR